MKWKFSKVTALLLAGAMVVTSGCTDYKDDIQDLNKRLDDLNAETVANFETQKTAMETLQKELEKADDDIQKNIDNIESDIKKLQDADKVLEQAMKNADAALKKELEAADAALKKAMEDADSKLKQAMESGDSATLAAAKADAKANLDAAKAELQKQIEGVQSNLDSEIKKVNEIIATLATKEELATAKSELQEELKVAVALLNQRIDKEVETLNATIETAVEELKGMIAALDAKKLDKSVFEDYKTEVARHFAAIENSIAALDTRLTTQIANLEADLNGKISALDSRMASAEAAIKRIEGETIPAIVDQIAALDEQIRKNTNDLAEYKALTDRSIALLQVAVKDLADGLATLDSKVDSLGNKLEQYYSNIQAALNDRVLTAVFEQYKQDVEWKLKDMKADYEGQIAETKAALEKKIAALEKDCADRTTMLSEILQNQIKAVKSELTQKIENLDSGIKIINQQLNALQISVQTLQTDLNKAINDINEITKEGGIIDSRIAAAISKAIEYFDAEIKKVNETVSALTSRVDQVEVDVDDLLKRIQSIVYVPDYDDGKITIEYAVLNDKVVEGQSKITYKVLPASETNTTLLAQAWKADNSILDFASHEVAIRAAGNEMFQIKDVEANGDLLTLTVATRGLGDDFYGVNDENIATDSYSIALLVNYENNIRSTEYANCVAGSPKTIKMHIAYKNENVEQTSAEAAAESVADTYGIEYTHILNSEKYKETDTKKVLEGHKPVFTVGGKTFTLEEMTNMGYAIDLASEVAYAVNPEADAEVFANEPAEAGKIELGTIASVSLGKEKAAAVGAVETVTYKYTACGLDLYVAGTVSVDPVTAPVQFNPIEIKWNYLLDAESDYNKLNDNTKEHTSRSLVVVIDEAQTDLPAETEWKDVVAVEPVITYETAADVNPTVVFGANDEGKPTMAISEFKWGETYNITAKYELDNVTVTAKVTVTTFDRARTPITIDLGTENYDFVRDLVIENEINDKLTDVYEKINGPRTDEQDAPKQDFTVIDAEMTAEQFLVDIFANAKHPFTYVNNKVVGSSEAEKNGGYDEDGDKAEAWTSKLAIAEDGLSVYCNYTFASHFVFDQDNNLTYYKTIKTWYGQEITLVKKIHFVLPNYNYVASDYVVEEDVNVNGLWFSSVNPKYADSDNVALEDKMSPLVFFYDVWTVNMNQAFDIVKIIPGKESEMLNKDTEKAAGLVRVFEIETPEAERPGITMNDNEIYYGGDAEYVDVFGRLFIENTDGSRVELPTSFATTYADYQVRKYDPLYGMSSITVEQPVDNAKTYTINVLEGIEWKDKRGFDLIANGTFVVGDGTDKTGFANGRNVTDVYNLTIENDALKKINNLPPTIQQFVSWDDDSLSLIFDYTGQMELKKPIELDIEVTINYTWGPSKSTTVHCVFKKAE